MSTPPPLGYKAIAKQWLLFEVVQEFAGLPRAKALAFACIQEVVG